MQTFLSFATHNRAGEITYCPDENNPLKYYFTITTYTDPVSSNADRCEIEVQYKTLAGVVMEIDTIDRVNNGTGAFCSCGHGNCGELVSGTVKKNVYTTTRTFSGAGSFIISVNDPNRNDGILNIPNSVNTTFYVQDTIVIDNFIGNNCTPTLNFPPIDNGCTFEIYQHNPGAVDPEGDSLVFSIIPCWIESGPIPGYEFPNQAPAQNALTTLEINSQSGTLTWDSPQVQGEYNVCILINEFRQGVNIGSMVRDMQITIAACNNDPPQIELNTPLCVTAGDTIEEEVRASDNNGDFIILTSTGDPYVVNNPATFDTVMGTGNVISQFYWETNCNNVQKDPYLAYFRAEDQGADVNLVVYETMEIMVVAPEPENLTAAPLGYSINLDWDESLCSNATGYKVYRKIDSLGWTPTDCETGVPAYTGYELIDNISGIAITEYTDDDNGAGLLHGYQYCYMVVACFADGAESYASLEACAELVKDVPVITHVTVNTTNSTAGSDSIMWSYPVDLDTTIYLGPYYYEVYRNGQLVGTTPSNNSLIQLDTFYVDAGINTTIQNTYRVELYYTNGLVGGSQDASSVLLSAAPTDNQLDLSWDFTVPWANASYIVHKYNETTLVFDTLTITTNQNYSDTGLLNGKEYCYYVTSVGEYSASGFVNPLYNRSQELCSAPVDNVEPCEPSALNASAGCEDFQNGLTWVNPNTICSDDVVGYNIYFAPLIGDELVLIDSIRDAEETNYTQIFEGSIAGCYSVTAIDTFYNESSFSDTVCVDNCPVYELPLVFSPGVDGINDVFIPFPYRFIESIDIEIYNRWGALVFKSTDPALNWDGNYQTNGNPCTSGVYYYVCDVNEYRVTGIEQRTLTGYIQLIREDEQKGQ